MTDSLSPMDADGGTVMEPACASGFRSAGQYCSLSEKYKELRREPAGRLEQWRAALLVDPLPDARPQRASEDLTASASTPALGPFP
jgi:hypothetical protein